MQTLFDIRGLTAVITGGSGQLGRAMAHGLAGAGVRVAVVSLNAGTSGTVAEAIRVFGQTRRLAWNTLVACKSGLGLRHRPSSAR